MSHLSRLSIVSAGLAGCLAAQNNQHAAPGLSRSPAPSAVFDITKAPLAGLGNNIQQISAQHLTSDKPGEWTVALSLGNLAAAYNDNGTTLGLVLGTYNLDKGTLVLGTQANALNSADQDANVHLEPGLGRYAVYDRFNGTNWNFIGVMFASRASSAVAFGAPVQIANVVGVGTIGFSDAALGYVGGKLSLIYVGEINGVRAIYRDDLDVSNLAAPKCAGSPVMVVQSAFSPGKPNSPTPITGPDGDVEGLWHCDRPATGNVNDMYWSNDLDPNTPPRFAFGSNNWLNNGAVIGGLLLCGDGTTNWQKIGEARGAWLLGDEEKIGGTLDIFGASYTSDPTKPNLTALLLSTAIGRAWQFPGIYGSLVLDLPSMLHIGTMVHDSQQMAKAAISVPNDPALSGKRFAVQGLSLQVRNDLPSSIATFTSSASLRIR